MIPCLLLQLALSASSADQPPRFADPERLFAGEHPLNHVEQMPFPSPVMFDADADGQLELVCGDLWGYLWIYEDQGEAGDTRWSTSRKLEVNREPLKLPNW